MLTEQYVSYGTAKLLEEKGFDVQCGNAYYNGILVDYTLFGMCLGGEFIYAPTQQMAMRWLREAHNIVICAELANENDKGNTDYTNPDRWHWFFDLTNEKGVVIAPESDYILNEFDSYEDAVEAAIQYCLTNLI